MSWKVHETDEVFAALRGLCSNSYRVYDPSEHRSYYDHDCETYECAVEDAAQEYERLLRHCEKQREELAAIKNPLGKLKEAFMDNVDGSSKVRAGSSITDELREAMSPCISDEWLTIPKSEFETLADRIDAEHERKVRQAHADGLNEQIDYLERFVPSNYVLLPVDADGVPININDKVDGYGKMHRVCQLRLYTDRDWSFVDEHGDTYYDMAGFTHVKPDSWERIMDDAEKLARGDNAAVMELVERCRRLAGEGA